MTFEQEVAEVTERWTAKGAKDAKWGTNSTFNSERNQRAEGAPPEAWWGVEGSGQ